MSDADLFSDDDAEAIGAAKRLSDQADNDLIALMAAAGGRRVMAALLDRCGLGRTSFIGARPEPMITAFLEGERNIGLEYLARIRRLCPDRYLAMLKEQLDQESASSGGCNA